MMYQITSDYFCAGIIIGQKAAPIIKYMENWPFWKIKDYCLMKKWKIERVK